MVLWEALEGAVASKWVVVCVAEFQVLGEPLEKVLVGAACLLVALLVSAVSEVVLGVVFELKASLLAFVEVVFVESIVVVLFQVFVVVIQALAG